MTMVRQVRKWVKSVRTHENDGTDGVKEKDMNDVLECEYLRTLKLVINSKLNGGNKIKAVNTWAVAILRYGGGVIR